jgi:dTDP-glucose pyrophosphorylase
MAGEGSRFSEQGYKEIKPLIPIMGKPMIQRVVEAAGFEDANWIFIVQKRHREQYDLDGILKKIRPGCLVIDTGGGVTEGAACTVLLAKYQINPEAPLVILNSDNILRVRKYMFEQMEFGACDGVIYCFIPNDKSSKWSFIEPKPSEAVARVAEKERISDIATAGMYVWRRGRFFIEAAEQMIAKNIRVNGEFYVAPVFNENIENGQLIEWELVLSMDGVGTPEDLADYIRKNS